jgi:hypothetical protein
LQPNIVLPLSNELLAFCMLIALLGGLVRGTTGFGAAMVMTPILAVLIGAREAVPLTLFLETFAALPMLPAAVNIAHWRVIGPISLAALPAVPLGAMLLASADPTESRYAIAIVVIVFALALLSGRRYSGQQRMRTSVTLGALSGAMLGATGIGAPPVILYLLSGPDPASVTRANLTLYIVAISAAGLAMLGVEGLVNGSTVASAGWLAIPFAAGIVMGSRMFARFSDERFRRVTIVFMMLVALSVLFVRA